MNAADYQRSFSTGHARTGRKRHRSSQRAAGERVGTMSILRGCSRNVSA